MVKWKKMNKKMAGLLLGVMMLFTASTTAFAYVDESAEASKVETIQTEQSTDKEEKKDEATNTNEVLPEDGTDKGTAFTTPGNGEVKDDITDDSTKEFLTVTTKNNNTFYIVIDRSATSQNVYMLSQIDENDLSEFLDKDSTYPFQEGQRQSLLLFLIHPFVYLFVHRIVPLHYKFLLILYTFPSLPSQILLIPVLV